jgi:hypothetical protein
VQIYKSVPKGISRRHTNKKLQILLDNKKTTNWEKVKYIEIKQMKENRVEKSFLKAAESIRRAWPDARNTRKKLNNFVCKRKCSIIQNSNAILAIF